MFNLKTSGLLFLLAFLFSSDTYSQEYRNFYDKRNSADYEYRYNKNPERAIVLLEEAGSIWKLRSGELEMMAHCLLATGDTIEAIKYIKQTILEYNTPIRRIRNVYGRLSNSAYFKEIESSYDDLREQYYCFQNVELMIEIQEMLARDQFVRTHESSFKSEEEWYKLYREVDSLNIYRLREIHQEYGFLPYYGCFVLLMHGVMDFQEVWEYFEPELRKGIREGTYFPDSYAFIFDRRRVWVEGKNSWYGEWSEGGPFSDAIGKIDDIENVDKRRLGIGLCTLKEKAEKSDLKLPENYHFK